MSSDDTTPPPTSPAPPPAPFIDPRNPRVQLLLAIAIVVFPALLQAIWSWTTRQPEPSVLWSGIVLIGSSLSIVAAMLLLMAASGSPLSEFGIIRDHPVQDVFTGLIWTIGQFWLPGLLIGTIAVIPGLREMDADLSPPRPEFTGSIPAWSVYILALICNSFAEEFAIRGVIFTRIRLMSGSAVHATIWSSVLFASYHIYQGPFAAAQVFVSGVLFCLAFIVHRSIWVGVVTHTAINILSHVWYG